jgi:hypothetical protein
MLCYCIFRWDCLWSRRKSKLNFLEPRIFVVTFIFTFISGLVNGFEPYLYIILVDYGIIETGIVASIIGALFFLINPVLFYITLFSSVNETS